MESGRLPRPQSSGVTRRDLLKGGALVVSFSLLSPLSKAFGQATAHIDPYGNPDYLEDANGNGLVGSGETHWDNPGDGGLRVLITQPKTGQILP